jgi:hypothetical protein
MDGRYWLNAADAARYLSLRTPVFRRRVRAGILPPGSPALGSRATRWSTNELDRLMRGGDPKVGKSIGELIQTYIDSGALKARGRRRKIQEPA